MNEKRGDYTQTRAQSTEEVVKLLTTILTQVKDQPALQSRPLPDKALAANAAYNDLRQFLAHK